MAQEDKKENTGSLPVSWWFTFFLSISVDVLIRYVELYNMNALTNNARIALEAINSIE